MKICKQSYHTAEIRYPVAWLYAFVNCVFPLLLSCASGFRVERGMTGKRKGVQKMGGCESNEDM